MFKSVASHLSPAGTPQTAPLPGRAQVQNSAGGYVFEVDAWARLRRFLVLGSDGGTYYAGERELTLDSVGAVKAAVLLDARRAVAEIVAVSEAGRAPKNDPALLALAVVATAGEPAARQHAWAALPQVARIGTHLFHFAEFYKQLGGRWGRAARRAFAAWYTERDVGHLALQAIKYQARDGWAHRDLLRLSHPRCVNPTRQALFHWMTQGWEAVGEDPHPDGVLARVWAFERAKKLTAAADTGELCALIAEYDLPHECVPTEAKRSAAVWRALLPGMGLTALIRNLGKLTSVGVIDSFGLYTQAVAARLVDAAALKDQRVHPLQVLTALKIYGQGHGDKGALHWQPNQKIVDALDAGFYAAFGAVAPTGQNTVLALDVSGSMATNQIAGSPLTCREAAAAMALITLAVEPHAVVYGFGHTYHELQISPRQRLGDVTAYMAGLAFERTNCALPMQHATQQRQPVDAFAVYTDNETYHGTVHASVALQQHRLVTGRASRLAVVGMALNRFSIADPQDAGMLDVVGFDTATPQVLSDFFGG